MITTKNIPKGLWCSDGSLRDIYIHNTNIQDWETCLGWAKSYEYSYYFDGEEKNLLDAKSIFSDRSGSHLLKINVGSNPICINCHFFIVSQIEMDIDPIEIKNEDTQNELFSALAILSHRLNKKIFITPENSEEDPLVVYDYAEKNWIRKA